MIGDILPLVAVLREGRRVTGYALGWVCYTASGLRVGHMERFYVRPKYRGSRARLLALRAVWDAACRRRGLAVTTTRVEKRRPNVAQLAARVGKFIPYGADERCVWLYRTL